MSDFIEPLSEEQADRLRNTLTELVEGEAFVFVFKTANRQFEMVTNLSFEEASKIIKALSEVT